MCFFEIGPIYIKVKMYSLKQTHFFLFTSEFIGLSTDGVGGCGLGGNTQDIIQLYCLTCPLCGFPCPFLSLCGLFSIQQFTKSHLICIASTFNIKCGTHISMFYKSISGGLSEQFFVASITRICNAYRFKNNVDLIEENITCSTSSFIFAVQAGHHSLNLNCTPIGKKDDDDDDNDNEDNNDDGNE